MAWDVSLARFMSKNENRKNKYKYYHKMANKQVKGVEETNEALTKSQAFFVKNKKAIIISAAAIVVIIVGIFLYNAYVQKPRAEKASTELGKGQQYFNAGDFEKALNGDKVNYNGFLKIASDYSSTDAGNLANLYAGLCYANMDKWNEAVQYLDKFNGKDDAMISPAALAALGNAYAHVNQLDKAVSTLKKAAEKADSKAEGKVNYSLAPTFMMQAAEILESQNKKEEALKIYQDIKKKYINSAVVQSSEIDKYIERASR